MPHVEHIYAAVQKQDIPIEKVDSRFIASGFPAASDDYSQQKLNLHKLLVSNASSTYFMRVCGLDLETDHIFNNDLLVVDRSVNAISGKFVVAVVKDEFLIARLSISKTERFLISQKKQIPLSEDSFIWGVVTYIIHEE